MMIMPFSDKELEDIAAIISGLNRLLKNSKPQQIVKFNLTKVPKEITVGRFLLLRSECGKYVIYKIPGDMKFYVYDGYNIYFPKSDTTLFGIGTTLEMAIRICEGQELLNQSSR